MTFSAGSLQYLPGPPLGDRCARVNNPTQFYGVYFILNPKALYYSNEKYPNVMALVSPVKKKNYPVFTHVKLKKKKKNSSQSTSIVTQNNKYKTLGI